MAVIEHNETPVNSRSSADTAALLADIDAFYDAHIRLLGVVEKTKILTLVVRSSVARGDPMRDVLAVLPLADIRKELNGAIEHLETTRQACRVSGVYAGTREGMTLGEFADIWDFSRTIMTRLAKQARERFGPGVRQSRPGRPSALEPEADAP